MRIGVQLDTSRPFADAAAEISMMEDLGIDLVSVPEAYTFDGVSRLGFLAAVTDQVQLTSGILPLYSRTPTLLAMTAAGLDEVSGGRFTLGLGTSGPQVIEGFHGVPYDAPLARTREAVEICRMVWRRERLVYNGDHYQVPLPESLGTGLGKPLKLIDHPRRPAIPVNLAAIGPRSVRLAAEIADGWEPLLLFPEQTAAVWAPALTAGLEVRDENLGPLDVVASAACAIGEDTAELLSLCRAHLALYVGGMGARGKNFYNDLAHRYGFGEEARVVQDLYLNGDRAAAAAALPDVLVERTNLIGSVSWVRDRLAAYAAAGVTTLKVSLPQTERTSRLRSIEVLCQLARDTAQETSPAPHPSVSSLPTVAHRLRVSV